MQQHAGTTITADRPAAAINGTEDDTNTSPESAALARGAAASAKRAAASGSIGRLPITAEAASKLPQVRHPVPKPRISRPLPRARAATSPTTAAHQAAKVSRIKVKTPRVANQSIAKATDRVSTGMDVWNAATTTEQTSTDTKSKKWISRMPSFTQVASFARTFATNTVMGVAVFAAYEGTVDHFATKRVTIETDKSTSSQNADNVSILQHFVAGGVGGSSHAFISLVLEARFNPLNQYTTSLTSNQSKVASIPIPKQFASSISSVSIQYPTMRYSISTIAHHSLAHSILFGSYQSTKWLLSEYFTNQSRQFDESGREAIGNASSIAIAGGIAGQAQNLISHFTEQWLGLSAAEVKDTGVKRYRQITMPTVRPVLMAFPPSAIGFLAYEYGRMLQ